jgi:hypothetical protein
MGEQWYANISAIGLLCDQLKYQDCIKYLLICF